MRKKRNGRRRVCFVTGTRAEFGLMQTALEAIRDHGRLELQIVATGMHLDRRHGRTMELLSEAGFAPDAVVRWPAGTGRSAAFNAANTGRAMADMAAVFKELGSDIVLVVGDRVEAFAAAAAAYVSHLAVAHVHGGDRAMGQVDDALRHAITKLAHIHFPATRQSAQRIERLGEERRRIHRVGSPAVDGIKKQAAGWPAIAKSFAGLGRRRYAVVVLHPVDADDVVEHERADLVLSAVMQAGFDRIVVIYPNNDPGSGGIVRRWEEADRDGRLLIRRNARRQDFLGLVRDAAVLAGNSSSGIIEAATFGTPVVDIGPRQHGRERSGNVVQCGYNSAAIGRALQQVWRGGRPLRRRCANVYGTGGAGRKMADVLACADLKWETLRKVIVY